MSNTVDAKKVGELRAQTGAGIIDCKNALTESQGDFEAAILILKKKGLASAAKKASRATAEGIVESYIHAGGRIGVLVQLNCETDFVAKNDSFKSLARDIAMHIAALSPRYLSREDVPADIVAQEQKIAQEQCADKPAQAVEKIVQGKLEKFFAENCLLEQPFVKNQDITIKTLIAENIARIGENITLSQFVRYQIGT